MDNKESRRAPGHLKGNLSLKGVSSREANLSQPGEPLRNSGWGGRNPSSGITATKENQGKGDNSSLNKKKMAEIIELGEEKFIELLSKMNALNRKRRERRRSGGTKEGTNSL